MSYVGKILVVVQVVLSLLFMAFAGAVFSMHQNWRSKYDGVQTQLDETNKQVQTLQGELDLARTDYELKETEAKEQIGTLTARNQQKDIQISNLQKEKNELDSLLGEQTGLAESKANEAKFRQQDAAKQRIENDKLRVALDESVAENRNLTDQLFTTNTDLESLRGAFNKQLEKVAYLERVVAANGLETDPDVVAKLKLPPPPVDGLILQAQKTRANQVKFVAISIGSDDGLIVGHELDVYRLNEGESESNWLGKIRIVDVSPDTAVGEVILPAKNGIIQAGDSVTSKFTKLVSFTTNN